MGFKKHSLASSQHRLNVLVPITLALGFLFVSTQLLVWSATGQGSVAHAQSGTTPVVTPTLTVEEAIQAYRNAHIIDGDIMPTPTPSTNEEEDVNIESTAMVSYSVALLSDMNSINMPGEVITYALTVSNTGTMSDVYDITATSVWPIDISDQVITLTGGTETQLFVGITIPVTATEGSADTAVITAQSQTVMTVTDSVALTTTVGFYKLYLPTIFRPTPPPPVPTLSATRPNSANDWYVNWTVSSDLYILSYELQQSQDATFMTGVTTFTPNKTAASQLFNTNEPSPNNVYYYRIRAIGSEYSDWSNTVKVVGAYYDDFTNNQTGWSGPTLKDALRRLTFIEKIDSWYENNDWLIIRVEDSWDWAIASPLKPAPEPPYMIEFRSEPANLGNLVSHGVVFGADWGGAPCPDWSSYEGVYAHKNCFNHFYNSNLIWSSNTDLTLLWERVDTLVWCPNCDGSPLKRLGDVPAAMNFHPNASNWNDYRIEVRPSEIKFFMNGELRYTYTDTRWIQDPYFGVFASTDEYSNSTWRYEYLRVTPLDN